MPKIMGILNATPDSFYSKSRFCDLESATAHGIKLWEEGVDILDIGGESSRPNAIEVDEEEELKRVIPLIRALRQKVSIPLSIDTYKPAVARAAIESGASLINDITGFRDPAMRFLAAEKEVDVCLMHMQGTPQTMQKNPSYPEGIIPHLIQWFNEQIEFLLQAGVKLNKIIIDPGIGFGKTFADNLEILQNLQELKALGLPILLGISRKSFLSKILDKPTEDLLPGTLAVSACALKDGVDILRVHDVREHRDLLKIMGYLRKDV